MNVSGSMGNSEFTVQGGTTLKGTGTVGPVTVLTGGTIAPGASIGTTNIVGNYTLSSGAVQENELNAAGQTDLLQITGSADLQANSILRVVASCW